MPKIPPAPWVSHVAGGGTVIYAADGTAICDDPHPDAEALIKASPKLLETLIKEAKAGREMLAPGCLNYLTYEQISQIEKEVIYMESLIKEAGGEIDA